MPLLIHEGRLVLPAPPLVRCARCHMWREPAGADRRVCGPCLAELAATWDDVTATQEPPR